jgi:hypothetical protein
VDPVRGAIARLGPTPTLLEWDDRIPAFAEVEAEAARAADPGRCHRRGRPCRLNSCRAAASSPRPRALRGDSRERTDGPRAWDGLAGFVATAEALLTPSAALDPVARLELYHRQCRYAADSLAEDFP